MAVNRYEFDKYDILSSIRFRSREVLRALQNSKEHTTDYMAAAKKSEAKDKMSQIILSEKQWIADRTIEKLELGSEEIEVILTLNSFCCIMDAEKVRTRLQVQRLVQENKWLRTELIDLQKRLMKLEESVVAAEAEKQHFQFVYKMRNQQRDDEQIYNYLIDAEDEEDTDPEDEIPAKVKAVHNLCMEYIREKRYEVAIPLCEEHIHQIKSKQGDNNNDIATLYSIIAKVHKEQGNLAEAQRFYEDCLKLREKVLGKEHNSVGVTLTSLAQVHYRRNNVKEAEKLATQALKIREKTAGKSTAEIALIHSHLGMYACHLAKWNDVINHYKVALGIYDQMYDNTDSLIIKAHSNMANAYVKLKQNENACEMLSLVCKSFQQKNSNTSDNSLTIFQTAQQHAEGKLADLNAEYLMKSYGAYENAIDKDVLETIIEYFNNIKKSSTAESLKIWIEFSNKQPNPVVRQSIVARSSKRPSELLVKKESGTSQSSKKDKSSIMGFFKKEKKK